MPDAPLARLLIVDDEVPQMKALCETLKAQGFATTGFNSGKDALAAMKAAKFDLLLSDLMMPEIDGIALLREALALDPDLVSIIMTGEGTIATAVEAMKAGAFDFILKPFRLGSILPVISRALGVQRLRIQNAELQQRVLDRTAELEAANKQLEAFSYSISHDLRAPLRHIDGFAQILREDYAAQLPPEGLRRLDLIAASARRMSQLIEDLLRFSRLGRQPLSKQPVAMTSLVREVLNELRPDWGARVDQVAVGDLPDCSGDFALLKQVFINLLSNGLKFTKKKESPAVEVGSFPKDGDTVYFVKDNGAGFDMQYAEKLFGVFQRMHGTDEFEGTGVGLSIVHRIVQRHGGRIWAEAAVGTGAAFYFTLPAG